MESTSPGVDRDGPPIRYAAARAFAAMARSSAWCRTSIQQQREAVAGRYFAPFADPASFASLRGTGGATPLAITQQVRDAVASLDADIPLYWVYSMPEALARPTWFVRVFGTMFMIFGVRRAVPRVDRPLRGDVVLGEPAHPRSGNSHGARRAGRDVVRLISGRGCWQLGDSGITFGPSIAAAVSDVGYPVRRAAARSAGVRRRGGRTLQSRGCLRA